jgi:Ca2+-binding EF-hand superfamily protein
MSRLILCCTVLAGLALLAGVPAGQAADTSAAGENDIQKLVYLGERGPVLLHLHLRIDGQSFRARHRAFIDTLFDYLDRDRDGVLSRAEMAAAPPAATLSNPLGLFGFARRAPNRVARPNSGNKMTREDLLRYYRQTGLRPFQMSDSANQTVLVRGPFAANEPSAERLTDRLFQLLDTDRDGKLSRKELEAAPAILGKLDVDEDEMISTAELLGEADGSGDFVPAIVRRIGPADQAPQVLHMVPNDSNGDVLAKALLRRYGKGGDTLLPASMPRLSKETLALLDRDNDGKLSLEELARFASKPADVTLTVRLGDRSGEPLMRLVGDRKLPAGIEAKATSEGMTLQFGTTRLDLRTGGSTQQALPRNIRDRLKTLFQRADSNNDGFVDRMEAQRGGLFAASFDAIDRDGKGKFSEKDLLAFYDKMESLRKQVERACVSLAVSNDGKGLFEMLDSNGDGKLSIRELRNAPKLLAQLDSDRDGKLARSEVPRRYGAALVLGPSGGNAGLRRVPAVALRGRMPDRRAAAVRGPLWFRKMDRNRDGDVSRKEFLGTDEQFKEIDTDGDGLISLAEAEAYDKRKRDATEGARR